MQDIIKKMHFKGAGTVLNAPGLIEKELVKLGFVTALSQAGTNSNTLVFLKDRKELLSFLSGALKQIEPDSVLWFAYPKGTSKIKTDINRDSIARTAEEYGITTVTAVSINDTWSGLRFRPIDKVGK